MRYRQHGLLGLENRKTAPKNPANRTAREVIEKVLHLRRPIVSGPSASSGIWRDISHRYLRCRSVSQAQWPQPAAWRHAGSQNPHSAI